MARVLVVEDDPEILGLVVMRVKGGGHNVIAVGSAEHALEVVAAKGPPDLAVLDISLPGINGLELLGALREQDAMTHLPIVFLSASVQPEQIRAGRALGATYLTKPFVASALLTAINDLLKRPAPDGVDGW